ncbi:hypothetical protein BC937DRAFT_90755 [Endogone sp. FLAS-F59071]|nr:hypothetical protein BC937DRAFT_90755 [Endogone sp. FLAS-F59071]|eukprot:RUS16824.1 hypothetical protein BC937DRAFT_90755 [Endogone sp. FLAS-F59071]
MFLLLYKLAAIVDQYLSGPPEDMRMLNLMQRIVREEGYQGLFRGLIPRLAKVMPSCAIMISSYEVGKAFFARRSARMGEGKVLKELVGVEL